MIKKDFGKELYINIFFLIFLFIGILIYADYGISIDEDNTRIIGFLSLKNIFNFLPQDFTYKIDELIKSQRDAHEGFETSGVWFDLSMAFLELLFGIEESKNYYLLRHFSTFLVFFISVYIFYLILFKKYKSYFLAILGSLFLILSPRIFANSFFNNKDIVFMSFVIFTIYSGILLLERKNIKYSIFFSIISALMINLRILGIFIPIVFFLIYFINIFYEKNTTKKNIKPLLLSIFIIPIFIIFTNPNIWSDPINLLVINIKNLLEHNLGIYTFYLGQFISTSNPPWHYSIVWIFITTPLMYIFFFIVGVFTIFKDLFRRWLEPQNNYFFRIFNSSAQQQDFIFLIIFLVPLFIAAYFGSISYDGWRHLYFIYPCFLLISISGIDFLRNIFNKNIKYLYILIFLLLIPTSLWMYKNHPHQYVYFNILAGKNFNKNFEMDYFGISNKSILEYVAASEKENVKLFNLSTTDLNLSKQILNEEDKQKIQIVGNLDDADYITNNFRDWNGKTKPYKFKIPKNFLKIHEIVVDNVPINIVYKKIN